METVADVIKALGGISVAAGKLATPATTVSSWKIRNRLPASYWPRVVAASDGSISYETLGHITERALAENSNEAAA